MQFQGALVKEQGVTFAIVVVKPHVVQCQHTARKAAASFSSIFPGMPIVLMAQNSRGVPTYSGRRDIVNFLANVPVSAIPWRSYNRS
jgi:hypothetical protein